MIKKVFQFKDVRQHGHGTVHSVGIDVGQALQKINNEYPNGDWFGGYEVKVDGYDVLAYPEIKPINDEVEYLELFDDVIYNALIDIGKAKGITINNEIITNEMLGQLRSRIIDYIEVVTDYTVNLLPPEELEVGDTIYVDENETFHIISLHVLDDEMVGLLDLNGYVSGTYNDISSLILYLNNECKSYEIIKDGYKKS
jgi:hypothetical protein